MLCSWQCGGPHFFCSKTVNCPCFIPGTRSIDRPGGLLTLSLLSPPSDTVSRCKFLKTVSTAWWEYCYLQQSPFTSFNAAISGISLLEFSVKSSHTIFQMRKCLACKWPKGIASLVRLPFYLSKQQWMYKFSGRKSRGRFLHVCCS